uniref:(northern house mosquito) hypothetical protein n=1 Tax=Culex pipiens TaxID=7175 RepID=A0A8D8G713_CULPI
MDCVRRFGPSLWRGLTFRGWRSFTVLPRATLILSTSIILWVRSALCLESFRRCIRFRSSAQIQLPVSPFVERMAYVSCANRTNRAYSSVKFYPTIRAVPSWATWTRAPRRRRSCGTSSRRETRASCPGTCWSRTSEATCTSRTEPAIPSGGRAKTYQPARWKPR